MKPGRGEAARDRATEIPDFDAVFVGSTILDVVGRPATKIPEGGGVAFIDEIRLDPAGAASGAAMKPAKLGVSTAVVDDLPRPSGFRKSVAN
jgi:hypothetical protein